MTWDLRRVGEPFQLKPRKLEAIFFWAPVEHSKCKFGIGQVPRDEALIALMEAAS